MCKELVELKVDEFLEVVPTTWEELTEHLEKAYTWTNDRTEYYLSVDAVKKLVTNFLKSKGLALNE